MNAAIETSCCFTGHRIEKLEELAYPLDELAQQLYAATKDTIGMGYRTFYHGGCTGVDLIAAEQVILLKQSWPNIHLISVLPFEGQSDRWDEQWRIRYFSVLDQSEVIILYQHYTRGCYHERDRYIVDKSRLLIGAYANLEGGTKYTVDYAARQGRKIQNVMKDPNLLLPKNRRDTGTMKRLIHHRQ